MENAATEKVITSSVAANISASIFTNIIAKSAETVKGSAEKLVVFQK